MSCPETPCFDPWYSPCDVYKVVGGGPDCSAALTPNAGFNPTPPAIPYNAAGSEVEIAADY